MLQNLLCTKTHIQNREMDETVEHPPKLSSAPQHFTVTAMQVPVARI